MAVFRKFRRQYRRKTIRKGRKLATVSTVKRLIGRNIEHKFTALKDSFTADGTPTLIHPCATSQGLTDNDRVGDKIMIKSLKFKSLCRRSSSDTSLACWVRYTLFQYRQDSVNEPAVAAYVYQYPGAFDNLLSPVPTHDYAKEVNVLADKLVKLTPNSAASRVTLTLPKKFAKQLEYKATSTSGYNDLFLFVTSGGYYSTYGPTVWHDSKFTFTDA